MKRLLSYLILFLSCALYFSCLNAAAAKKSSENTTHITSDELVYEIKTKGTLTSTQLPKPHTPKKKKVATLNNSTHQEMLVVYTL
jgi:hypothetical protein